MSGRRFESAATGNSQGYPREIDRIPEFAFFDPGRSASTGTDPEGFRPPVGIGSPRVV